MSPPAVIRVLVADDQRVVREGLVMLLGLLGGIEVVGAAADGEQAVALATELRPHAVLMDLRMPRVDGVAATRRLRERDPGIKVLALTTYDDERSVVEALRAGARGYLTKDAGAEQIRQALEAVVRGEAAIDPAVQHHLVDALATAAPATTGTLPGRPDAARGRGAVADRRRALQRRARRPSGGQRGHRHDLAPPAGVLTARSRPVRR
jgi:DNA-binding NarL/FixJ family response regulator